MVRNCPSSILLLCKCKEQLERKDRNTDKVIHTVLYHPNLINQEENTLAPMQLDGILQKINSKHVFAECKTDGFAINTFANIQH